ncbi:hypothetical protein [Legionella sp. km535]|nr:hypothetical protein [Legionella sp. km535]
MKHHNHIAKHIKSAESGSNRHNKTTVFVIVLLSIALLCFN